MSRDASLVTRMGLLALLLLGLVGAILLLQQRAQVRRGVHAAASERGAAMARVLASGLAPALDFDDARAANELLRLAAAAPDVHSIAVFRADGSQLASWGDAPPAAAGASVHLEIEEDLLFVRMPAFTPAGTIGNIHLVLSLADANARIAASVRKSAAFTLAVLGAGLVIALFGGRRIARPIRGVTEVATRIAAGDEAAARDLPLQRRDEVGRLASAFAEMLLRLRAERSELALQGEQLAASLRELKQAQAQLVQAGKMAAVGTLVAGLSHELNSPLGVILGHAQGAALRLPPDHPERAAVLAIERQARRCRELVRTLLDFSRAKPAQRVRVEAAVLVERVASLAEPHARGREVRVDCACEPGLPVRVNPEEIETALLNLVRNAIDVTAPGGHVSVEARGDGVAWAEIEVRDQGAGIPPELRDRIFDPFFTTKAPGEGTGLGLSLARQFVDAHRGAIEVASEVGGGTAMRVRLPLAADAAPQGAAA